MRKSISLGLWAGIMMALAVILNVGAATPARAQTVAVGSLVQPVNLSNPGNVIAKVTRTATPNGAEAIDKFLHGTVRVQPDDGSGPQIAIDWHGLSGNPGGTDAVQLAPAMSSAYRPSGTQIPGGQEVPVAGDLNALIRAARTIVQNAQTTDQAPQEEDGGQAVAGTEEDGSVTTAGAGAPIENEEAKLPTIQGVTATETVETVVNNDVYGETTEGCSPVLSDDETYVTIMKAPTTNGAKSGDCAESLETATVQETFIGCGYDSMSSDDKAYATKRRYYVYGGSTTDIDTECTKDEEKSYAIVESADGCRIVPDLEEGIARQHMAKMFIGRENERVTVSSCAETADAPAFPIEFELCAYRDDFAKKITHQTHIAKYVGPDGLKRNIGNCLDTGVTYTHIEDTSVCPALVDYGKNKLFQQYRIRIDIDGQPNFRTPSCKPFAEALTDLLETQAGCETFHADYDGFSLGGKRIIRKDTQAQVRECREADVRYEHIHEAEGWVNDDANLQATPREATYIMLPQPAGKTLVTAARVRDGAGPQAYVYQRSFSRDGNLEYQGGSCDLYRQQKKMMEYKRPDGTLWEVQDGFNDPIGPTWDCRYEVSTAWPRITGSTATHHRRRDNTCGRRWDPGQDEQNNAGWHYYSSYYASSEYTGTRKTIRGDGKIVAEETNKVWKTDCSKTCQGANGHPFQGSVGLPNRCPVTETNFTQIANWKASLGW